MSEDELYMLRCIELARLGTGFTAPNPMVGAVLVHNGRIIGEGYHRKYGEGHAEVNCLTSVQQDELHLIPRSVLYVSLEPCAHFGKTPPCTNLIIDKQIPKVVIGCRDPFKDVNGKGIEKLLQAGIQIVTGILNEQCIELNQRFFTFHTLRRPYILLKWAQSRNHNIANANLSRVLITNEVTNRLVHKWRGEEAAIMIGTNTALYDNPELNTRKWSGNNPVRLVADINLRLPPVLHIFDQKQKTIVFNQLQRKEDGNVFYYQVTEDVSLVQQVIDACHHLNILSILVEGGAHLLQSFIDERAWDEARIITNNELVIPAGLPAPQLHDHHMISTDKFFSDTVHYCKSVKSSY